MAPAPHEASRGLPRTFQRSCLLVALSEGQSHGYELLDAVRQMGMRGAEAGGLYRCLRAMEEEGLVTSWWEASQSGPPRRTYTLTKIGIAARDEAILRLQEVCDLLRSLLENRRGLLGCHER